MRGDLRVDQLDRSESSKRKLLKLLQQKERASAKELAGVLKVTRACVHAHLQDLMSEGLVTQCGELRRGRGRPVHLFALTGEGRSSFPNGYAKLAWDMLGEIKARYGHEALEELLDTRNQTLCQRWQQELAGKPLCERLQKLAEHLRELGYDANVDLKNASLVMSCCPYPDAKGNHPEVCAAEAKLYETLLGVRLEREDSTNGVCCKYRPRAVRREE